MKYRFYITSMFNGTITGTDDPTVARELAECEDYFVVDAEAGMWLQPDGIEVQINETQ